MKILLTAVGTRGDMEPFLAIGVMLLKKGHEVRCLFPEQFRSLAVDANLQFASIGTEFIDMLDSDIGKFVMGGSGSKWKKFMAYVKLAKMQPKINKAMVLKQFDTVQHFQPDRIVYHTKAMYPVLWEIKNPGKTVQVSPVPYLHYVRDKTHLFFNSNYGSFLNRLTYKLADFGLEKTIWNAAKRLEVKHITKRQMKNAFERHKVIYTISPLLFSRPTYWTANLKVFGYHERDKTSHWQANDELLRFLEDHPKILFVTFGSMTNPEPKQKTRIILEILKRNSIPAIINTSSGGLIQPESYDKRLFYFVKSIPYDWILPKMYGVIHHGGSGTTHLTIKNGCASLIIPHIIDQFLWNKLAHEKGVGPLGIKIGNISEENLAPKIKALFHDPVYKQKAEILGAEMNKEDFTEELIHEIIA